MYYEQTPTLHDEIQGVVVYNGLTTQTKARYERNIAFLQSQITPWLEPMIPSTFTIQGQYSNLEFNEAGLIGCLRPPTGAIMLIGCNYGTILNPAYKPSEIVTKSGRGRKPVTKTKAKRKSQGSGEFFSSQITFNVLEGPKTYKIKVFRTGGFQLPYSNKMTLEGLLPPLSVIRDYLRGELLEDVQITHMMTTMRNYKTQIKNPSLHVNLDTLYRVLLKEKQAVHIQPYIKWLFDSLSDEQYAKFTPYIGKTNALNMAEILHSSDRSFSLNVKYYRPLPNKLDKKMTVKMLKTSKINLDGCNNELEGLELYYYTQYLYQKYAAEVIVDITTILNEYNADEMNELACDTFIYG